HRPASLILQQHARFPFLAAVPQATTAPPLSPRAVARLETVRDYYEHLTPRQAQSTRLHQQSLAPYYRHLTEAGASILEVGCGSGELLQHFKDHDLAGIDLSPRRIAEIRNRIPEGDFQV